MKTHDCNIAVEVERFMIKTIKLKSGLKQGPIQPVRLGWEAILVTFGSQASLRVHYCKRDTVS